MSSFTRLISVVVRDGLGMVYVGIGCAWDIGYLMLYDCLTCGNGSSLVGGDGYVELSRRAEGDVEA